MKNTVHLAPMVEYGRGIVFRSQLSNGVFYDGSIRVGRLKMDFESVDFSWNGYNVYEKFESNSPYISALVVKLKQIKN